MLEKIFKFTTLRNLSVLSKTQIKLGKINAVRCYSVKPFTTNSVPVGFLTKPIILKSDSFCASSLQLTKIIGNNFIQKRFYASHGDHVALWKLERILSAAFIPLIPLCFIFESSILDSILAIVSVVHVHRGLETIIVDYARPEVVGPIIPKVCFISLHLLCAFTFAGLVGLIYYGPGISKVIKNGWAIGKSESI